ncbi:MAG: hypothetical protein JWQ45_670 [Blastococcus sp.]|nr:hypothetical protein [Blastococcus sp.]
MSVLPVQVVDGHQPWSKDHVATLSDHGVLARAAALVGLPTDRLPLPLRWGNTPAQIAALRTAAELLLTRLEQTSGACPDCTGTEQRLACAQELGRLEARLDALAHDAKLVLSWLEDSPARD